MDLFIFYIIIGFIIIIEKIFNCDIKDMYACKLERKHVVV
jgi:hypothetical protein